MQQQHPLTILACLIGVSGLVVNIDQWVRVSYGFCSEFHTLSNSAKIWKIS